MKKLFTTLCVTALIIVLTSTSGYGQAIRFSAGKVLQTSTNVTSLTDNVTMECWARWDGSAPGSNLIIYNGNASTSGYGLYLDAGNQIHFLAGGVNDVLTGYIMTANVWTHLAIRRTAGSWHLIVNGIQQGWTVASTPSAPGAPGFIVGDAFRGDIDEVRIWNAAIPTPTILAQYPQSVTSSHPNFASLAAYYPMNEGTGQTTADVRGGNTMTFGATTGVAADDPTWITESSPISVPTLGEWAMIIFGIGMVGVAWYYMRKRRAALA